MCYYQESLQKKKVENKNSLQSTATMLDEGHNVHEDKGYATSEHKLKSSRLYNWSSNHCLWRLTASHTQGFLSSRDPSSVSSASFLSVAQFKREASEALSFGAFGTSQFKEKETVMGSAKLEKESRSSGKELMSLGLGVKSSLVMLIKARLLKKYFWESANTKIYSLVFLPGLERWLLNYEHLLLFPKTQVQFPMWQFPNSLTVPGI